MRAHLEEVLKNKRIPFKRDACTATLSTFRIGGTAAYLIEPLCLQELVEAVAACRMVGVPYRIMGRGSNILFDDGYLSLALIRTTRLNAVREERCGFIADCGVSLMHLSRLAAARGFADLTFAAGIPGTVGGAVYMNAGAHEKALGDTVNWVKALAPDTGKIKTVFHKELSFSYRKSVFQANNAIILQACFTMRECCVPAAVRAQAAALLARRAATQPLNLPSAGSVFLRTEDGVSMGKIIDELGLKGKRRGNAAVSEKHAGFIVNLGGATAADVRGLIAEIQDIVEKERGFRPMTEIRFITENKRS